MAHYIKRAFSTLASTVPQSSSANPTYPIESIGTENKQAITTIPKSKRQNQIVMAQMDAAQLPSKQKAIGTKRAQPLASVSGNVQPIRSTEGEKPIPKTPEKKKPRKKHLPDTPPPVVTDARRGLDYARGRSLGEGGFARCFLFENEEGEISAAKVVTKKSLSSHRMKSKVGSSNFDSITYN